MIVCDRPRPVRRVLESRCAAGVAFMSVVLCGMLVPGGRVLIKGGGRRSRVMRTVTLPRRHAAGGERQSNEPN
jgi:hypothetical protein